MTVIEDSVAGTPDESAVDKTRPTWWNTALTLGHLEARLHATKLLDSPPEYRQALLMYAKKIADEGFRSKAEELVKELYGPVYWCVRIFSFIPDWRKLIQMSIGAQAEKIHGVQLWLDPRNEIC